MAHSCDICGKGPRFGNRVSHANNVTPRVWYPNIQRIRIQVGRSRKRKHVCTRCLRSGIVLKAVS